jgi:hypothetical protein
MVTIALMIVVVIIPVAIRAPAAAVFVPPAVRVRPAVLPFPAQSVSCTVCLPALPAIPFSGLMHLTVGSRDAPLAIPLIGANRRCADKSQSSSQRRACKRGPYPQELFHSNLHFDSVLLTID